MKELLKCYGIFLPGTGKLFKLLLFFVFPMLPLIMLLICNLYQQNDQDAVRVFPEILIFMNIALLELCIDYELFMGIDSKSSIVTNYLKYPSNGFSFLEKALKVDTIRRIYTLILPSVLICIIEAITQNNVNYDTIITLLVICSIVFFAEEVTFMTVRQFSNINIIMIIGFLIIYVLGYNAGIVSILIIHAAGAYKELVETVICVLLFVCSLFLSKNRIKRSVRIGKGRLYD